MAEQVKKRQKRKWGPTLRIDRPRRVLEDGRTIMQKTQNLKEARNTIKGMTQKTSFAFESNEVLLRKAMSVNISFGNDSKNVQKKLNNLKNKELGDREAFENNNPEVNLSSNLDIAVSVEYFRPSNDVCAGPTKQPSYMDPKSWVDVASKSCGDNFDIVSNDRSLLEY
jgi:hypothetical protein